MMFQTPIRHRLTSTKKLSTLCLTRDVKVRAIVLGIDFIQNTVTEGDWNYDQAVLNNELPEAGSFNMYKEDGSYQ